MQFTVMEDGLVSKAEPLLKNQVLVATAWYLSKGHLQVGDAVRSRKPLNACKPQNMDVSSGTVVDVDSDTDRNGFVLVKIAGIRNPLRVQESTLERVTSGFAMGDWVRLKEEHGRHSPVGIIHSIDREGGGVTVGFVGLGTLWMGSASELQIAKVYCVGQFVRLKANVVTPRFEWPRRLVFGDESNSFLADPAEVELVSFDTCPGVVEKYQHVEDFHWVVRPLVIALGVFTAAKLTISVGRKVSTKLRMGQRSGNGHYQDGSAGNNAAWFPPPVANILFKEGVPTATVRDDGEKLSLAKYGLWRREQKTHAARLQKQLKAQWEFEQLIEEQLNRFRANYNCDMVPTRLKDVAQSLMPKWALPHELAALPGLGIGGPLPFWTSFVAWCTPRQP
ncbi:hypothetical protein GH714_023310 [Hevea brasiliensis]|uniref:Uncharacterized protein n=1 Tax=Hevea brasiliensis TaxID=3981 RepID=A0A6A6LIS5_HEVBR|nr:hypothetical protein GH714_023310 [Hevea brasiliensis]